MGKKIVFRYNCIRQMMKLWCSCGRCVTQSERTDC